MKYLGIDIETTGLNPRKDRILEIAVVALDENWQELWTHDEVINCPFAMKICDDYVKEMHTTNELLDDIAYGLGSDLADVEHDLVQSIEDHKPIVVGSSVQFDLAFIEHWMPLLHSKLSHRIVDDRTLKEVLGVSIERKGTEHRALADIRNTIEVIREARGLNKFRQTLEGKYKGVSIGPQEDLSHLEHDAAARGEL